MILCFDGKKERKARLPGDMIFFEFWAKWVHECSEKTNTVCHYVNCDLQFLKKQTTFMRPLLGHGKITKQPVSHRSDVVLRISSLSMFIPLCVPSLYIPISQVLARFLNHQISTLLRILGIKGMELDVAFGFVRLRWRWNHTVWDDLEKPYFRYSITSTIHPINYTYWTAGFVRTINRQ